MNTVVAASPELKRLWIQVLKQVHPALAVDEQDRRRCERLTQQANDAYARRDEVALRAVLGPKAAPPARPVPHDAWYSRAQAQQATAPESTNQPPLVPQQPPTVIGREVSGILGAAGAVLCLLLYGIFNALSAKAGRGTSISLLVLLTAAVLWLISRHSKLSDNQKARWAGAVASGMILVAICLMCSRPSPNPLFPSARAATAHAPATPVAWKGGGHAIPANQLNATNAHSSPSNTPAETVMSPRPASVESPALPLSAYIEAEKTKVALKWNPSQVAGDIPAGATVYIQFTIRRRGTHEPPMMETSSGFASLDNSCLGAVDQIQTFDRLPRSYSGDSLTVVYHCTYPGALPAGQAPPVDALHNVAQTHP